MRSDEYRRLYAVCITTAEQSNLADVRTRWLALAQDLLSLSEESPADFRARKCVEDRSKSRLTGLSPARVRCSARGVKHPAFQAVASGLLGSERKQAQM
jgi:hypothetical protein